MRARIICKVEARQFEKADLYTTKAQWSTNLETFKLDMYAIYKYFIEIKTGQLHTHVWFYADDVIMLTMYIHNIHQA